MVDRIRRIVAGHENQDLYADEFLKNGVVAVGWGGTGDISGMTEDQLKEVCVSEYEDPNVAKSVLLRFRDNIKVGDPVIAYKSPNTVVGVGRIASEYFFDDEDELGSPGELFYPHKRKVNWIEKPRLFNRNLLPEDLSTLVSLPGTFKSFDYDYKLIEDVLEKIPGEAEKEKVLEVESEEEMRFYFTNNIKQIESGLVVVDERDTSAGQVDILAKDGDSWVVVELKINASDSAVGQLMGYMSAIKEDKNTEKVRGIILAENINPRVKKAIGLLNNNGPDIRLYECKKKFVVEKST